MSDHDVPAEKINSILFDFCDPTNVLCISYIHIVTTDLVVTKSANSIIIIITILSNDSNEFRVMRYTDFKMGKWQHW